jgi:hypothetical protein
LKGRIILGVVLLKRGQEIVHARTLMTATMSGAPCMTAVRTATALNQSVPSIRKINRIDIEVKEKGKEVKMLNAVR